MSSLSSPLNFRSVNSISSCNFDSCVYLVRNVQFRRNGSSFRTRWKYGGVCKHFVTANYIAEQGTSISLDSAHRVRKDNADDSLIIPVSKSGSKVEPLLSMAWDETGRGGSSDDETTSDKDKERSRVIESLGEVLERAEKLESSKQVRLRVVESLGEVLEKAEKLEISKQVVRLSLSADKPPADERANRKTVVPNKDKSVQSKYKATKSIWRKGNPVSAVQRVSDEPRVDGERGAGFKTIAPPLWRKGDPVAAVPEVFEEPRVDGEGGTGFKTVGPLLWRKGDPVAAVQKVFKEPRVDGEGATGFKTVAPFRPSQPPRRAEAKLPIREPVIFKDVNAAAESPVGSETDLGSSPKLRKPKLIDRFAVKKPVVDPLIAKAVLAPPKPGKNPATSRFKGELRKKTDSSDGPRRRMVADKGDIPDEDLSEFSSSTARKGRKWSKASRKAARLRAARDAAPVRMEIIEVSEDGMLTEELAYNLAISEGEILGYMFAKGIRPDGVQKLSKEMVRMICKEYGVEVIDALSVRVEDMAKKKEILDEDDLDKLEYRPPVLTIMGHVDHGKTTLLDYIRKTKVAAAEAGGITQGIGAYTVQVPFDGNTQTCVFLDTPGHEAFGAMRARGARVTDIAVIVVAADDGIQPQTNEAIAHAKAAGVPIVVAINKIDKDGANPDRVVQDLSSVGLMPEEWGGDIPMVKISALKGENVDELLETVILVAELEELKANPHRNAKGIAIEAGLDKSKGPVATFIVQNGTLKRGDIIVCGEAFGKVRALFDDNRKQVDKAGPSIPVQVLGLNNVPLAGDEFEVVSSHDVARERAEARAEYLRNEHITAKAGDGKVTLSSFASAVSRGNSAGLDLHQLNIILKVDVQGSLEAVRQALQVLPQDNITLKFLLQVTGDVSSSDVDLAVASKAIIFGFNVKAPGSVKKYADHKNVEVRLYKVIYELIDDVRKAMEGLLDHVEEQVPIGSAEVRAVFSSGSSRVAGCMVTEGKVVKDCGIRVLRKGKEVHVGVLSSLRRVKEMVKEVNAGLECGIGTEGFTDWEVGDTIEAFTAVQKKRTLEEASASMSAALEDVRIQL